MLGLRFICLIFFVVCTVSSLEPPVALPIGYLTTSDKNILKQVLIEGLNGDVKSYYYALRGYSALKEKFDATEMACNVLKHIPNADDMEALHFSLSGLNILGNVKCKVQLPELSKALQEKLNSPLTVENLFYTISSAKRLNVSLDFEKASTTIKELRKTQMSMIDLYYTIRSAIELSWSKKALEIFIPDIVSTIETADESDGLYVYLENSPFSTSLLIDILFELAKAIQQPPAIPEQKLVKCANYLYSYRFTRRPRVAAHLSSAFNTLSSNEFMVPVVVSGESGLDIAGVSGLQVLPNRQVKLRLTNVLGDSTNLLFSDISLTAGGLYLLPTNSSSDPSLIGTATRGVFKSIEKGLFVLDLQTKDEFIPHGHYFLELNAKSKKSGKSASLVGVTNARIPLRLLTNVDVQSASISLFKSESSRQPFEIPLTFNELLIAPSEVSSGHGYVVLQQRDRLAFSFRLVDSILFSPIEPHQVFVQLTHKDTEQSITYVCQKESPDGKYVFDLQPDSVASDFDYLSGVYTSELIVGDVLLTNSFVWKFANLDLRFPVDEDAMHRTSSNVDVAKRTVVSVAGSKRSTVNSLIGEGPGKAKPDLVHTFRTPEPRPSDIVSLTFTGLCLAPIGLLLISWLVIGINFWNFPISLSAPIFHVGLIGIFGLYLLYWFQLNMFVTLRYLCIIGLITFLAGNRLLRHLVTVRKSTMGGKADL